MFEYQCLSSRCRILRFHGTDDPALMSCPGCGGRGAKVQQPARPPASPHAHHCKHCKLNEMALTSALCPNNPHGGHEIVPGEGFG